MNPIIRFLASLRNLANSGVIKSVDQAMDFAKREFGEVNDLLKRQIEQVFKQPKAPRPGEGGITSIKNPPKKETPPQESGTIMDRIGAASNRIDEILKEREAMYKPKPETSPLMEKLEKGIETLKQMKKPGMDLATGLTRTAARKILDRAGIQVPDKVDPTEIFIKEFGADVLGDVQNVAEEMIEIERMGKSVKSIDEILEQEGMFNLKRGRTDMPRGYTDEEMEEIKKAIEQEDILLGFDPKDRKPNSQGGINRAMYAFGSGVKLAKFLANKGKNLKQEIKKAVDNIFTTDDIKYDADVAVDTMFEELGVDRDMFDQKDVLDAYSMAYNELKIPLLQKLQKPTKSIESMKKTGSIDISDPEIAGEMDRFAKQADPEGYKKMEEAMKKAADEAQPIEYFLGTRKKNSKGGLQYLMGL